MADRNMIAQPEVSDSDAAIMAAQAAEQYCFLDHDGYEPDQRLRKAVDVLVLLNGNCRFTIPICLECAKELYVQNWNYHLRFCFGCGKTNWIHKSQMNVMKDLQIHFYQQCPYCAPRIM